jgi:hypothetical protein
VAIAPNPSAMPGESARVLAEVRDAEFAPVADAHVDVRVTVPGGEVRDVRATLADAREGQFAADIAFEQPGVYKVRVDARQGARALGSAERWMLVGGADLEMADPRLNEDVLRRVARASGGRYLSARDARDVAGLLTSQPPIPGPPRLQELWHTSWFFFAAMLLLASEWWLRRRWGLR